MKKTLTFGIATLMIAGMAGAQDNVMVGQAPENDPAQTKVTAEAALVSSYVWRGQVYNNDFVMQPQITASQYGFSLNFWGNYDLGKNLAGVSSDFSEMDIALAYTLPLNINDFSLDVGVINYNFPNSATQSTAELFGSATLLTLQDYVIPSVTLFGDIDEARGTYVQFDIVAPYEVSDYLSVEGGFSAGWGNTSYNDYYFGYAGNGFSQDKGWNDFNFYANANYEVAENVTASLNLTYTTLEGGSIGNAAKVIYEAKEKFWGGVNIAYDF